MNPFRNLDWGNWAYGLIAGFIGGGSGAVTAGIVAGIRDPKDYAIGGWNSLHLIGWVFLVNGLLSAILYLKQNPLPNKITVTTITERQTLPTEPPTTITKKVEETVKTVQPKEEPKP